MKQQKKIMSQDDLILVIKEMRQMQKVTQEQIAEFSGLHRNGISKLERGESDPKLSTLLNILSLLGARLIVEMPENGK